MHMPRLVLSCQRLAVPSGVNLHVHFHKTRMCFSLSCRCTLVGSPCCKRAQWWTLMPTWKVHVLKWYRPEISTALVVTAFSLCKPASLDGELRGIFKLILHIQQRKRTEDKVNNCTGCLLTCSLPSCPLVCAVLSLRVCANIFNFAFQNWVCNQSALVQACFVTGSHTALLAPPLKKKKTALRRIPFTGCVNNLAYASEAWTGIETASLFQPWESPWIAAACLHCDLVLFQVHSEKLRNWTERRNGADKTGTAILCLICSWCCHLWNAQISMLPDLPGSYALILFLAGTVLPKHGEGGTNLCGLIAWSCTQLLAADVAVLLHGCCILFTYKC